MALTALVAMVRKDLQIFFGDRRALIMAFAAPIAIASFFGSIFARAGGSDEPARIPVRIVDVDGSAISKAIVAGVQADRNLNATVSVETDARAAVRRGAATVAVIIPKGFGDAAGAAFFSGRDKPRLELLYDPSRGFELAMVRGILTEHVMQAVSKEVFTGASSRRIIADTLNRLDSLSLPPEDQRALRNLLEAVQDFTNRASPTVASPGLSRPYDVREEAIVARANAAYNGYAHAFAGMGVQFLLFAAVDLGIGILLERQRGLWKRL
ncbi:MAG: ABC transporter permease, partial [Actinobacteria bacterium]